MHRVDVQGRRRGRLGLSILALSVAALALVVFPAFASADFVALEISKEGGGEGTVISVPIGIDCGVGCEAEFEEGTEVTLSESADANSEFLEWEGCDSEPEGKCKITMAEPRNVTAVFEEAELPEYSLTVEEAGSGEGEVECLVGKEEVFCEEEFPKGTHVTIKAIPYLEYGSEFGGFSEDCAGSTGKICILTMDEDHTVTVTFSLKEFTLTVNKHGGVSSGKVECELEEGLKPCQSKYPWGTEVALIAVAEPGYEFVKWEGCDTEPEPGLCEVEIEAKRTVTVTFGKEQSGSIYILKVKKDGTGSGIVTSSPTGISCGGTCSAKYPEGKEVTLTVAASAGSEFASWSGCVSQPEPGKCKVVMSADREVVATFDPTLMSKFALAVEKSGTGTGTVVSSPAGIDCGVICSAEFAKGTEVALKPIADAGSKFTRWTGGGCAFEEICTTTVSAGKTVQAVFNSAEPMSMPVAKGKAKVVRRVVLVRGGRVLLELRCTGGPCQGQLKLIATVKVGGGRRSLVVGRRSFELASGVEGTLRVRLTGSLAKRELARRGKVMTEVKGRGVVSSTLKLRSARDALSG